MRRLMDWHRFLAYSAALFLLGWMLSGLVHPVLSRMGPELKMHPQWLESPDALVQARLALPPEIAQVSAQVSLLTEFNDEYQRFQKILPVHRVQFADPLNTVVMIDPSTGKILSGTDEQKLTWTRWFKHLHTLDFLPSGLALGLKTAFAAASVVLLGLGGTLLWQRRSRGLPNSGSVSRRWHRRLGLLVLIPFLCFSLSGLAHLWREELPRPLQAAEKWTFNTLHKWRFMDPAGRDLRDLTQGAVVLSMVVVLALGLNNAAGRRPKV